MKPEAELRLAKAILFLEMADKEPQDAREPMIHLAYYAMLHAASAGLIERLGQAPKTRGSVIRQFSQQIHSTEQGRSLGRAFNHAEESRLMADYDVETRPNADTAIRMRDVAHEFVAYCRSPL